MPANLRRDLSDGHQLADIDRAVLLDGWLACAPATLARVYLDARRSPPPRTATRK